ncbi:MAG: N-6 DNA methylase [Clostridia bacterium]|nr:N-6 DNA methylase [Clostridia bacterium]
MPVKYMTVKEASDKFGMSVRIIQQLCEAARIEGAQRVGGRWIIPGNAPKPVARLFMPSRTRQMLSLNDVCHELGVSAATGRNWLKLGKLVPSDGSGRSPEFDASYIMKLKAELESGSNNALKSRRNKKYVSGNGIYSLYLDSGCDGVASVTATLAYIEGSHIEITDGLIRTVLASAAVQMLSAEHGMAMSLGDFLADRDGSGLPCASLVLDLLEGIHAGDYISRHPELYEIPYAPEGCNDVLGLLYISCLNARDRKAAGAYYTPAEVVDVMVSDLMKEGMLQGRILDPCCGTGNFLLRLPDCVRIENVYGNDVDAVSVMVARINLALKYGLKDTDILYRNMTVSDYLTEYDSCGFECVIGNPPWGYAFDKVETVVLDGMYRSACGSRTESYDVFIEKALSSLKPGGVMSFVVPEAVLNVRSHQEVRQVILDMAEIRSIRYMGNVFSGVQCPCVVMTLERTACGTHKNTETGEYLCSAKVSWSGVQTIVCAGRGISPECFNLNITEEEYAVLRKLGSLSDVWYLKDNATFALGIVTGNNKGYVSSVKTDSNEMVLRGSDLRKFRFMPSGRYIAFTPERFQQVAPEECYRAPEKLLYRFICSQLVFAYDDQGTLSLNSCNILIPKLPGLSCKYVMAVLNSRVAQFWFRKQYNSIKVLRSHIEQIPIPYADGCTQRDVEILADRICSASRGDEIQRLYDELDALVAGLYGLNGAEYDVVRERTDGENLFLV